MQNDTNCQPYQVFFEVEVNVIEMWATEPYNYGML